MIAEAVTNAAQTAVAARFDMRDDALRKEFEQVIALAARDSFARDDGRLGVRVRLLCERDLQHRAGLAWGALRKAHHELDGAYRAGLQGALYRQLDAFMRDATLRLAAQLRQRASDLLEVFSGVKAVDAEWIGRQRRSAVERQAQSIEDYVRQLPRTRVGSIIKR